MARFVRFEDVGGNTVFINAEQVTYLLAYQPDQTQVYFGENHTVVVKEGVAFVASKLGD